MLNKKKIGARDLTQWQSACLSCTGLDGRDHEEEGCKNRHCVAC